MNRNILATLLILGATWPALGQDKSAIHLRLWPTAVVTGDEVLLAEICDYRGVPPEIETTVAFAMVSPAPVEGGSMEVNMSHVREALAGSGLNFANVIFEGASRCEIRRPNITPPPMKGRTPETVIIPAHDLAFTAADPEDGVPKAEPVTLRGVIRDWLLDRIGVAEGRLELQFGSAIVPYLELPTRENRFQIVSESQDLVGLVNLKVTIVENGKAPQVIPTAVQVQLWMPQVVARRSISARATIKMEDVTVEDRMVEKLSEARMSSSDEVLGMMAKRYISAGTSVTPNAVQPLPLVRKGQLVDVISSAGGVVIQTTARAASDGVLGARIHLRTTDRRREEMSGVVVGPNRVEVREAGANDTEVLAINTK